MLQCMSLAPTLTMIASGSVTRLATASCGAIRRSPRCWGPSSPRSIVAPLHPEVLDVPVVHEGEGLRERDGAALARLILRTWPRAPVARRVLPPWNRRSRRPGPAPRPGPGAAGTGLAVSRPTRSLTLPSSRRMPGAEKAVTMIALRFTVSANNTPPTRKTAVRRPSQARHPAIAPRSRVAPSATKAISHRKYLRHPSARASPSSAAAAARPGGAKASASWVSMLMSVRTSRGLTGPTKSTSVGSDRPNSTTSPGPAALHDGGVAPTLTVWPSATTDCSGATLQGEGDRRDRDHEQRCADDQPPDDLPCPGALDRALVRRPRCRWSIVRSSGSRSRWGPHPPYRGFPLEPPCAGRPAELRARGRARGCARDSRRPPARARRSPRARRR